MTKLDEIKDKLKKLIAKEESARKIGNLHEAEAFASKIQELLIQYELDIVEISSSAAETSTVNREQFDTEGLTTRHESNWVMFLYVACAKACFCKVILRGELTTTRIWIVGTTTNRELLHYMCASLLVKLRHLAKESFRSYEGPDKRNTYIRSFLKGATQGIKVRLNTDAQQAAANSSQVAGLVLRKDLAVQKYVEETFGMLGKAKGSRRTQTGSSADAFGKGYEAGKSVSINKGVGTRDTGGIKQLAT